MIYSRASDSRKLYFMRYLKDYTVHEFKRDAGIIIGLIRCSVN